MTKKIHKILACVDFSEYSMMVLEYAVELAKASNTEIVVFNVINQRDINGMESFIGYYPGYLSSGINMEEYVDGLKEDRHERLRLLIKENFFDEKSMMHIKVDTGIPFESILKAVASEEVDLVVMANKGRGNIAKVLFGSAAEKVFRHSPVPVISVRDRKKFKRER